MQKVNRYTFMVAFIGAIIAEVALYAIAEGAKAARSA